MEREEEGLPAGWKLVPVEPDNLMLCAGAAMCDEPSSDEDEARARGVYHAMLAAAPSPSPRLAEGVGETRRDEIRAAYIAGATKVLKWLEMPTDDLDEGADDYFAQLPEPPTP